MPDGVELWLVESMNPDGQAAQVRQNANGVDLNRNFPYKWGVDRRAGRSQYAGTGPASEPETQAIINLISQLRPDIVIWYHQDLFVISPAEGREGRVRARYAELTNWPMGGITRRHLHRRRRDLGPQRAVAATTASRSSSNSARPCHPRTPQLHANAVRIIGAEG